MRDLVTLAVLVAILGAVMWWQRRRHGDFERDARRSGLIGASSPRPSVLQLARVEVRFLHRHPATLVGLLLLPLGISLNVSFSSCLAREDACLDLDALALKR